MARRAQLERFEARSMRSYSSRPLRELDDADPRSRKRHHCVREEAVESHELVAGVGQGGVRSSYDRAV